MIDLSNNDEMQEWWKTPENMRIVRIIREVGVWVLGNFDGCSCCDFKIRNVEIDISCGKGRDRGLWIYSPSLDYWDEVTPNGNNVDLLRPIAEEVIRQVEKSDGRGPIPVHYHEWKNTDSGT